MSMIHNNPAASRYELAVEGATAVAKYQRQGNRLFITHVEVPAALRGKGAGSELMAGVVADAALHRLELVPICSFAAAYLQRTRA